MAIISESDLAIRLSHVNNAAKGRTAGANGIPDSLRELIGFQAHFEGAKEVASAFGVAPITAHLAKESRGHEEVSDKIKERLGVVRDQALEKMLTAMGVISEDRIKKLKIRGALQVIQGMASVIEKTDSKIPQVIGNQVIVYAPAVRSELDYANAIEVEKVG